MKLVRLSILLVFMVSGLSLMAQSSDLFFSEYIEGGSFNKALEVFNPTNGTVDLSNYRLVAGFNGATQSQTYTFTGGETLASGDVFVICHGSAASAIRSAADATSSSFCNFNGDDSLVLQKSVDGTWTTIDVIGEPGARTNWSFSDSGSTKDKTLVRKSTISHGNPTALGSFGTSSADCEWDVYGKDTMSYIGSHTYAGGGSTENDTDSVIEAPTGGQIAAKNISSANCSYNEFIDIMAFDIVDAGTADGLPTNVTFMRFYNNTPEQAFDWSMRIRDARLYDVATGITITSSDIDINDAYMDIILDGVTVDDNSRKTFKLMLSFDPFVVDNSTLQLGIQASDHSFLADEDGSGFADIFEADVISSIHTINVNASRLAFTLPEHYSYAGAFWYPNVVVSFKDTYGNIDVDADGAAGQVVLSTSGTFLGGSTTTVNANMGVATFNLGFTSTGVFTLTAQNPGGVIAGSFVEENVFVLPSEELPYTQDFSNGHSWGVAFPGWNAEDFTISETNYAGGVANEAYLSYSVDEPNRSYISSPAINTSGKTTVDVSWNQLLDYYTTDTFTVALYTSTNGVDYNNEVWRKQVSEDDAAPQNITLTADDGVGSATLSLRWEYIASDYNSFSGWSIDDIQVATEVEPTITVISPNGGESWTQGTTQDISWSNGGGFADNVTIELLNNGSLAATIASNIANTGSYSWDINEQAAGANYTIRVKQTATGNPVDVSDATFSVEEAVNIHSGDIVINEIMYNSTSNDEEWIELYNNTNRAVVLDNGWVLTCTSANWSYTFDGSFTIAAGGYATIEVGSSGNFPFTPDLVRSTSSNQLVNSTATLKLSYLGAAIDTVTYDDGNPWPTEADGSGPSIERIDPTLEFNSDNAAASMDDDGTPGSSNQVTTAPEAPADGGQASYGHIPGSNGNPAVTLDDTPGGSNVTLTAVAVNHGHHNDLPPAVVALNRWVTLTGAPSDGTTVSMYYTDAEVTAAGLDEALLQVASWNGSNWTQYPRGAGSDTVANVVTAENVVSFSEWIIFDGTETLPVELSTFSATFNQDSGNVKVNWNTASETGLLGYHLLRATVGQQPNRLTASIIRPEGSSHGSAYSYTDNQVETGTLYRYWLQSLDLDGTISLFGPVEVTVESPEGQGETPEYQVALGLHGNYPNPFNPETTISFRLPQAGTAKVVIYNLLGRVVRTYNCKVDSDEVQTLEFDGRDERGNGVPSGVYFYRLEAGKYTETKKMILMK